MAQYNYSYGARSDEVRKIQQQLNQHGYGLDEDGIYGQKTQDAVKRYQTENGLTSDGIVGEQTWGSLFGGAETQNAGSQTGGTQSSGSGSRTSYAGGYSPNGSVQEAMDYLEGVKGQKPGAYQGQYDEQIQGLYEQIMGQKPFSYNAEEDPMYKMYRDMYIQQGRTAMADTMGQAAALTGGYGSTYGQAVGQQQYNAYLQKLNEVVPDLYAQAYRMYGDDADRILQQLQLAQGMDDRDYGRYADAWQRWLQEMNLADSDYWNRMNFDYNAWQNAQKGYGGSGGGSGKTGKDDEEDAGQNALAGALAGAASGAAGYYPDGDEDMGNIQLMQLADAAANTVPGGVGSDAYIRFLRENGVPEKYWDVFREYYNRALRI